MMQFNEVAQEKCAAIIGTVTETTLKFSTAFSLLTTYTGADTGGGRPLPPSLLYCVASIISQLHFRMWQLSFPGQANKTCNRTAMILIHLHTNFKRVLHTAQSIWQSIYSTICIVSTFCLHYFSTFRLPAEIVPSCTKRFEVKWSFPR